jgi:protein MpaA
MMSIWERRTESMTPITRDRPIAALRQSAQALLAPLQALATTCDRLTAQNYGDDRHPLTRFVFDGPRSETYPIRIGIFAGIHGDEPQGPAALATFLIQLARQPALAANYRIYAYPICNPEGYEHNTRFSPAGKDLNREFWRASSEPEVHHLEAELRTQAFRGIISLHSDDTIDGFCAQRGLVEGNYEGILSAPADQQPAPFELTFETPARAPLSLQVQATVAALHCIVARYRQVVTIAQDI